jgi:hypothetical protein
MRLSAIWLRHYLDIASAAPVEAKRLVRARAGAAPIGWRATKFNAGIGHRILS